MTRSPTPWSDDAGQIVVDRVAEPSILVTLQAVQDAFGYVPAAAVPIVAQACHASRADVFGVLTYYRDLRQAPPTGTEVRICLGEACQAVGARPLRETVRSQLATSCEVTDVYCLGNCALGPSVAVEGRLLGRATVDAVMHAVTMERG